MNEANITMTIKYLPVVGIWILIKDNIRREFTSLTEVLNAIDTARKLEGVE